MLEKIIENYCKLSDSWISEIKIIDSENNIALELIIHCANRNKEYSYEKIKFLFSKIISYQLIRENIVNNFAPKDVFIKAKNGIITFDFFPIDHFDYLEENPNSEFIIKCKEISYIVLSSE